MDNLRVLVVDDEEDIGGFIKMKLQKTSSGLDISYVPGAKKCLELLGDNGVDCILSDYQMPGMNGMELLNEARRLGYDTPFIFITGQGSEEVASEAFRSGAYDYFTKEVGFAHFERITNSIKQAVKQVRAQQHSERVLEALKNTAEGVSAATGDTFFQSLVRYLADTLGVKFAFVGMLDSQGSRTIKTLALLAHGKIVDNFDYNLDGTPCDTVVGKELCTYPSDVQQSFPEDKLLVDMGIESYSGTPLTGSKGEPLGLLVIMDDKELTDPEAANSLLKIFAVRASVEVERSRYERALLESERRYRSILENVNLMAVMLDRDGRITFCNDYLLGLTGRNREAVTGKDWFDTFVPPDERDMLRKYFFEAMASGELSATFENHIVTKAGERIHVYWNNALLRDLEGNIVGATSIGDDLTERCSMFQ